MTFPCIQTEPQRHPFTLRQSAHWYFPWVLLPNVVLKISVARRWSLAELSDWDNTDVAALSIFLKTDAPISSFQHFNDSPVFLGFCSQIWFHKYAHRWHETLQNFPLGNNADLTWVAHCISAFKKKNKKKQPPFSKIQPMIFELWKIIQHMPLYPTCCLFTVWSTLMCAFVVFIQLSNLSAV